LTFALPMFGNAKLKESLEDDNLDKNMFHFVKSKDIVPGLLFIGHTYEELSTSVKILIKGGFGWVIDSFVDPVEKPEMNQIVKNLLAEVTKKKEHIGPLFQLKGQDYYVPIGRYVLLHDIEKKVYALPNETQWVGQALVDSLTILNNIGVRIGGLTPKAKEIGKTIVEDHSLDGYHDFIKKCLLDAA
jgi:hypothetical protein